jgi:hypothetical protein
MQPRYQFVQVPRAYFSQGKKDEEESEKYASQFDSLLKDASKE